MKDYESTGIKTSKYEKIAVDIAYGIINEEWKVGSIINGRTILSGKYSVSPETIRRALKLLEEKGVLKSIERKGIFINSKEAAISFIDEHKSKDKILLLRENISSMITIKREMEESILKKIDDIIEQATLLNNNGLVNPLEVKIPGHSHLVGKSIGEVRFWEYTGATIIGINRSGHLHLSPGPKLVFYSGDIVLYVNGLHEDSGRIIEYVEKSSMSN